MVQVDVLWNEVLEVMAGDLIRFVRPGDDFEDLEGGVRFADSVLDMLNFRGDTGHPGIVDRVVEIERRKGGKEYLLVHVEEVADEDLPERVFHAFGKLATELEEPVWAIVLVMDVVPGAGPLDCFSQKDAFGKECVRLEYPVLRVADFSDEELLASNNPFALVLLAAKKGLLRGRMTAGELLEERARLIAAVHGMTALMDRKREVLLRVVEERLPVRI